MLHWRAEGKNSSKRENFNCVFPCGREVLGLFKNCAHAVHENWTNGNIVLYEQGQKRPHDSCSSPAPSRWRITRIWVPQRTQEILLASGYIKSPTPPLQFFRTHQSDGREGHEAISCLDPLSLKKPRRYRTRLCCQPRQFPELIERGFLQSVLVSDDALH